MSAIHSACASSFARQHGKENTLKLLKSEIQKLESSIDIVSVANQENRKCFPHLFLGVVAAVWFPAKKFERQENLTKRANCLRQMEQNNQAIFSVSASKSNFDDVSHKKRESLLPVQFRV